MDQGLQSLCDILANTPWGAFDQRGDGFARTRDGNGDGVSACDRGALELAGAVVTPSSGGGGGGGGCSYNPHGRFDPVLPLLVLLSLICLGGFHRAKNQ